MLEYLAIAGIGAWLAGRGKPTTKVTKGKAYGPRTGVEWDTEYFPELGRLVVMARGSRVVFERSDAGLRVVGVSGDGRIVGLIRKDFEIA
jgi:hypothetical protein